MDPDEYRTQYERRDRGRPRADAERRSPDVQSMSTRELVAAIKDTMA